MRGIVEIITGLVVFLGGGALAIAWIAFCFGTVVVGILLLVFAPWILFSPLMFSLALGTATMRSGWEKLSGQSDY